MKKILLTTNTFGKNFRQDLAIEKLKILKENNKNLDVCLLQFEQECDIPYTDIKICKNLKRSSKSILNTKKELPFIKDLFDLSCDLAEEYFIYSNSDIILSQKFINFVNTKDIEAFGVSRIDVKEVNSLNEATYPTRMEPAGFDTWVVSKKWWSQHRHLFPDMLIGRPLFDVIFTVLMLFNSKNIHMSRDYLIYHIRHPLVSFDQDECYFYNEKIANDSFGELLDWWNTSIAKKTFLQRPDWGSFLKFLPNEESTIINEKQKINSDSKLSKFIFKLQTL